MKAASGVANLAASLLVACATAQSVDGNGAIVGSVPDGGHSHDSGMMPSGGGGSTDQGSTGGTPSTSSGGSEPASTGGAAGDGGDSSGGSGGTTQGDGASGGAAGASTGGVVAGSGGTTGDGGSTQSSGGACDSGQKMCTGACVTQTPANGCSATSCTPCPIPAPANGIQMCDPQGQCDFECLSGYQKNGALCTMGGGVGGAGAGGSSGSGGAPSMCGNDTCHKCLGNLIGCCNKQGDRCMCVLPNLTDQCGP